MAAGLIATIIPRLRNIAKHETVAGMVETFVTLGERANKPGQLRIIPIQFA